MASEKILFTTSSSVKSKRILYTPSDFAKASLLYLQEIGTLEALKPHTSRREKLTSYLCFIVKKGNGTLNYEGKEYELSQGDCVFIDCQSKYSHTTGEELWELSWVHFCGMAMPEIYRKYLERGGKPVFKPSNLERYEALFDEIYHKADAADYVKDMRINEKLSTLLTALMEDSWNPEEKTLGRKKREIVEIKNYLDQNYKEKISLDDLSQRFFISKFYLDKIFRKQYGYSITAYMQRIRITHAKHMLRFTDMSIEEIGVAVGMNDANYFTRMFKKIEGITPGKYRKMW